MFNGPLRRCTENPRYFTDNSGKAIYLTGAHTWPVNQDARAGDGEHEDICFDYEGYLRAMKAYGHNFLRFWTQESSVSMFGGGQALYYTYPMPYVQVGTRDGRIPVYDLTQLNQEYFDRIRERCILAGKYGIYVSVMLFEGWSVDTRSSYVFGSHPYNILNNVNGIDGNPPSEKKTALSGENDSNPFAPEEHIVVQTLENPEITALQRAYVKKVIEAVNDLDNVMYEICNEGLRWTRYWQYAMIGFIHETEQRMPKQHPVWMSHLVQAQNESLYISDAEAISPGVESTADNYCTDPPAGDGTKVIIADTDHLGGIWGTAQWAWKSFMRGLNPVFMDDIGMKGQKPGDIGGGNPEGISMLFGRFQYGLPENWEEPVRVALGRTRKWAERIDLTHMAPAGWVSSTGYCLADPGKEYLVYQPESGQFKVRLYGADAEFGVVWYNPETDEEMAGPSFTCPSAVDFTPPVTGPVLLYLKRK